MQPQHTKPAGAWVRLYLERQSESSSMPTSFVGYLTEETQGAYVLTKTLVAKEDEDTFDVAYEIVEELNVINRTYVWRCEILGERPYYESPYNGTGGLG